MTCSHASAPLSADTLAWRRKHDDFFATGILIRSLQAAFAQACPDLGRDGDFLSPVRRKSVGESRFLRVVELQKKAPNALESFDAKLK
jgi:hypothetical protein